MLAKYEDNRVEYQHRNPMTGSQRWTKADGTQASFHSSTELDPMGTDAGVVNWAALSELRRTGGELVAPRYGDSLDQIVGCTASGAPAACSGSFQDILRGGGADTFRDVGRNEHYQPVWLTGLRRDPTFGLGVGTFYGGRVVDEEYRSYQQRVPHLFFVGEEYSFDIFGYDSLPQKDSKQVLVPLKDINHLKELIQARLDYGDCKEVVAKLIAQISKNSNGKNEAAYTDIMGIFNQLTEVRINVPRGEYPHGQPNAGGLAFAWKDPIRINKNEFRYESKAWFYTMGAYENSSSLALQRIPYEYGITGIHEMIHLAANQGMMYDHSEMDNAAHDLDSTIDSVDEYLRLHCSPPKMR